MIQTIPKPERPYFIFSGKMWEIENEFTPLKDDRSRTEIKFEHKCSTSMIDPDVGYDLKKRSEAGPALTVYETVLIKINGVYDEPSISMYIRNTGTMVRKDEFKEIEPFSLPLYVIQKLVKEAEKIDKENRNEEPFSPEFLKLIDEMNETISK